MKTGIKKGSEHLLRVAIILCVLFSMSHLASFIYSHIPPYSAGQCLAAVRNPYITVRIDSNDIVGGYSNVTISMLGEEAKGPVSFVELRDPGLKEAECQK